LPTVWHRRTIWIAEVRAQLVTAHTGYSEEDDAMRASKLFVFGAVTLLGAVAGSDAEADHLSASVTLDPTASRFTDRLVITVTGSYSCDPFVPDNPGTDFASGFIEVRQAAGRGITLGGGFFQPQCDGNSQMFESNVPVDIFMAPDAGPWHGGPAHGVVSLFVQDCEPGFINCHNAFSIAEGTIRLTGPGR
jgi:hypothetical protein